MKFLKRLLIIAVCIATLVTLFYSWTSWWGARKLSAALTMLRDKNEPTRFEELVPAPVPDADNVAAAPVFQEVFVSAKDSRLVKLEIPWKKITRKPEPGESTIHFTARFLNPDFKGDDQAAGELVLESLAPAAPLLEEVAQAVRRPGVSWPIDYSKGFGSSRPHISPLLKISNLFLERARAELATGRPDNAFQDVQTLLALARASGSEPVLVSLLVELSILHMPHSVIGDGLERHAWTDAQLADLSSELSRIDLMARLSDALRGERTSVIQLRTDMLSPYGMPDTRTLRLQDAAELAVWAIWPAGWVNETKAGYIDTTQRSIDAVKQPRELPSTLAEIEASLVSRMQTWSKIDILQLSSALTPFLHAAKRIVAIQTFLRSLATACAVERYRMANDRLPATLENLVPAFLPSVPTDPLTGKPLCYKPSESSSYLIYGTGWDQTDNAGSGVSAINDFKNFTDQADWGVLVKF